MDESALRDVERWKDKIEVRLDNRQVFFLFFGSALCACMLFVLGVIVGKRLESRGRAAVPEVQDPLAVLDRINTPGQGGVGVGVGPAAGQRVDQALTFQKALIGAPARGRGASQTGVTVAAVTATPTAKAPSLGAPKALALAALKASAPVAVKSAAASAPAATKLPAPAATPKVQAPAAPKPTVASAPKVAAPVAAATATIASVSNKGKFALQLSSFADRTEADALAKRFAAQGAYVIVSEAPGKATMYRVRVGSYGSSQEAIAAKGSFEKQNNVIAYIAGR
jgi:cell division septation protein DedD